MEKIFRAHQRQASIDYSVPTEVPVVCSILDSEETRWAGRGDSVSTVFEITRGFVKCLLW